MDTYTDVNTSITESDTRSGCSEKHLCARLSVTVRVFGDPRQIFDSRLQGPSREDVGDRIRPLVRSWDGQLRGQTRTSTTYAC